MENTEKKENLNNTQAQENEEKPKSTFEMYCDENPEALECRIYDN